MSNTIQGVFNAMTPERREAADLIFGAIAEGDPRIGSKTPVGDKTVAQIIASMSRDELAAVVFIAGGILPGAQHSFDDSSFLAHYGRRGMKWGQHIFESKSGGVTNRLSKSTQNTPERRALARMAVKGGNTSLAVAHIAGLKGTGHRVANGILGDKTFWKRQGIIAGVALGGVAASLAVPALLPAGVLTHMGMSTAAFNAVSGHAVLVGGAGVHSHATVAGVAVLTKGAAIQLGQQAAFGIGLATTAVGAKTAHLVNYGSNVKRAIRGNLNIDKSFERLGKNIHNHQATGTKRVNNVLRKDGSLRKKDVQHDATATIENFLAHYGRRGMRWGQHLFTSSGGSSKKPGVASSEDHASAQAALRKPAHALSNQEMQTLITRLNLERQYAQVVHPAKPTTRTKKAASWAGKLMVDVGKQELTRVAKSAAAIQVESALKGKQMSGKDFQKALGKRISPTKKKSSGKGNQPASTKKSTTETVLNWS